MGRPVDRSEGVLLVTDYGALEWALKKKKEMSKRCPSCSCQAKATS
jgi:hypothetical protein